MTYTTGQRVKLVAMGEDPDPIDPGTEGTVTHVAELNFPGAKKQLQVGVSWDNGRTLSCLVPPDSLRVVNNP